MAKWIKTKNVIYKAVHEPNDNSGDELRCSGRVESFCSTCGTRRVSLVTNPMTQTFCDGERSATRTPP
jgi:hypothetical protein